MKFRKKPVLIEAVKYQAEFGNNRIMNWLAQHGADVSGWSFFDGEITIPTLEGRMKASDGDWIIKGIKGEFYPCKPDIFVASYDECGEKPLAAVKRPAEALIAINNDLAKMVTNWADNLGVKPSAVDVDSLVTNIQQRVLEALLA